MKISANTRDDGQIVDLYLDHEGAEFLISILSRIKNDFEHEHLMTAEWAGDEMEVNTPVTDEPETTVHQINLRLNHL